MNCYLDWPDPGSTAAAGGGNASARFDLLNVMRDPFVSISDKCGLTWRLPGHRSSRVNFLLNGSTGICMCISSNIGGARRWELPIIRKSVQHVWNNRERQLSPKYSECSDSCRAAIGKIFGHNRLRSRCLQVQPVTRWHPPVFLYSNWGIFYRFLRMSGNFPAVLNFNRLFLKFNQFICN